MRLLILYSVVFLLAICLGLLADTQAGYLFLVLRQTQIGIPLWLAVIGGIFLFLLLYWLVGLLRFVKNIPVRFRYFRQKKIEQKNRQQLKAAVFAMIQEKFPSAEKTFLKLAKQEDFKTLCYVFAAMAAEEKSDCLVQQEHLYHASQTALPEDEFVISLLQAKLYLNCGKQDAALMILVRLQSMKRNHPAVIKLLKAIYEERGDWKELERLLPAIRYAGFLSKTDFNTFQSDVYAHFLQGTDTLLQVRKRWKSLPNALCEDETIFIAYINQLLTAHCDDEAGRLIIKFLDKKWSDELIALFGYCKMRSPETQIRQAEKWKKKQPNNAILLLTLARIAINFNSWIQAEEYIFQSLNVKKTSDAYQLLASIHEQKGDMQQALKACRQAAESVFMEISNDNK